MTSGLIFRAAFWVLLGSLYVMRVYFMRRVRQAIADGYEEDFF